jgi:hypothetical protein
MLYKRIDHNTATLVSGKGNHINNLFFYGALTNAFIILLLLLLFAFTFLPLNNIIYSTVGVMGIYTKGNGSMGRNMEKVRR